MKIELNSIKNRLSTSFARRAIAIPLASLCKTMEQDVAIDSGESELKENRSLSLLVRAEKKSRHKEYSHGTVGSMSTVTQDLHGGRNALSAGDTRRSDIDSERPEEKQIVAVVCEVRETILFTKTTAAVQSGSCRSARHTRWRRSLLTGRCTQRPGVDSADQLCTVDLQPALDCTADWTAETECLYKST